MQTPIKAFTEIDSLNNILASVGAETAVESETIPGQPVSNLSFTAAQAYQTLRDAMRTLMSHAWGFNTEYEVELTSNSDGRIALDASGYAGEFISKVDLAPVDAGTLDITIRSDPANAGLRSLYDQKKHSFTEFGDTVTKKFTISYYLQFEDCPEVVKALVTAAASKEYQMQMVGNLYVDSILSQKLADANKAFIEYETDQDELSIFNNYDVWKIMSYQNRPSSGGWAWYE